MQLRAATFADIDAIGEIDGTIETTHKVRVDCSGQWPNLSWNLKSQALPQKVVLPNRLDDELRFMFRQIVIGAEEGIALVADYGGNLMAVATAKFELEAKLVRLLDVRVDFDYRRQGLASAMIFQIVQAAREKEMRGVHFTCKADNELGIAFVRKLGFELRGIDMQVDLASDQGDKETQLAWYLMM